MTDGELVRQTLAAELRRTKTCAPLAGRVTALCHAKSGAAMSSLRIGRRL